MYIVRVLMLVCSCWYSPFFYFSKPPDALQRAKQLPVATRSHRFNHRFSSFLSTSTRSIGSFVLARALSTCVVAPLKQCASADFSTASSLRHRSTRECLSQNPDAMDQEQATTPAAPALKKSTSSTQNTKNQKSILGFFQPKSSPSTTTAGKNARNNQSHDATTELPSSPAERAAEDKQARKDKGKGKGSVKSALPSSSNGSAVRKSRGGGSGSGSGSTLTPVPSSDVIEPGEAERDADAKREGDGGPGGSVGAGLPSPATLPANDGTPKNGSLTPSRTVRLATPTHTHFLLYI